MSTAIKALLKKAISGFVALLGGTTVGRYAYSQILAIAMGSTEAVEHRGVGLTFATPNALNLFRVETFSTKEPETLEWIDQIPTGSVLWDIGANVGLYSCYAAKTRQCRVFAFEPSIFNLELLARNIALNQLTDAVSVVPLPLTSSRGLNKLNMTTTEWGGALSTFGEAYGFDGQRLEKVFEYPTIGLSMDDATSLLALPLPDYVKMDVDGIEHLILAGGTRALRNAKGVLVEINDEFKDQAENAGRLLTEAGLSMRGKWRGQWGGPGTVTETFNQIWHRNASPELHD